MAKGGLLWEVRSALRHGQLAATCLHSAELCACLIAIPALQANGFQTECWCAVICNNCAKTLWTWVACFALSPTAANDVLRNQ